MLYEVRTWQDSGYHVADTSGSRRRPQFLILHLKRFIWSENKITAPATDENAENSPRPPRVEYVLKKKKDPVLLSEKLDLEPFRTPDVDWTSTLLTYSLKSIVYHHGMRAQSGHYDDTCTALISLETIVASKDKQERAYMLLYGLDQ
jgi:hypothetical protein